MLHGHAGMRNLHTLAKKKHIIGIEDVKFLKDHLCGALMTHKCRGPIVVLSISKSVEPNEEQKEMISSFQ